MQRSRGSIMNFCSCLWISIKCSFPLLTLFPLSCVLSLPQRRKENSTEAILASKSRISSLPFATFSPQLSMFSGCNSWHVPVKTQSGENSELWIKAASYFHKRDIINWTHKDHFVFINSLTHMRKLFDIFYTSNSFLHALLSRLNQNSVDIQLKGFRI